MYSCDVKWLCGRTLVQPRAHERRDGRVDGVHEPDPGDGGELFEAGRRGSKLMPAIVSAQSCRLVAPLISLMVAAITAAAALGVESSNHPPPSLAALKCRRALFLQIEIGIY